ncbi:Dienelactone hydrolase endo-1,3,1,4-beta-D-glucanase [Mycena kentingensis (nom. inval.)]|nr:Dienelactone hydrolase endo-1,3,1,4-beta-D-glucanase [Mycena kentingensis (nom. inval.)]
MLSIDKVLAWLKAEGVTTFLAMGYCFGARYAFDLAFEGVIKVAALAHPSLLQDVVVDFERYKITSVPLLINSCGPDEMFPPEAQATADKILANFAPGYKRLFYEGCVTHDGTPVGKMEQIGGDKVVLFLTDIFGLELVNSKLLADDFAANGFRTIIPDYLNGDPVPADAMGPGKDYDLMAWFKTHGAAETRPPLDKVIAALKAEGITTFAAVGYCLGGRYVFDLAFDGIIKAAATAHPSLLQIPDDLEKYKTTTVPLLINSCTTDQMFPLEAQAKADEILTDFAPGYKRNYFEGCTHGFAVRGDISDPKVKAGKEEAFKATIEWFIQHF